VLVHLAALLLARPGVLLLDEPTNNLDRDTRHRLYGAIEAWPGVILVVSHDRELLARVDQIADLASNREPNRMHSEVRIFGGNYPAYEQVLAAERAVAERAVRTATADVRQQRRDLNDTQTKLAGRERMGRKQQASGGQPRIVMGAKKRSAQVSAGKLRDIGEDRLAKAQDRLNEARETARPDAEIRVALPGTVVPAGRTVLTARGLTGTAWRPGDRPAPARPVTHMEGGVAGAPDPIRALPLDELIVRGPERIALTGPNGAGKTTLLRAFAGQTELPGVTVQTVAAIGGGVGYLPQRLDVLDDSLSVLDNVRRRAPAASVNQVRSGLARFLFRGDRPAQLAGTLSGGERFRATLAALLLADPPPQLLLLDEPTNNLDLASIRQFSTALASYGGALIVVSHDLPFLESIQITRWLRLDPDLGLSESRSA
jgi:ATPase subunit of ABC transporter with duplicated ATPase domains